jgi:hypothetical protein
MSTHFREIDRLLSEEPFSGIKVIDFLCQDQELKTLFEQDAGVSENYTIREHTERVYGVFDEQLPFFEPAIAQIKSLDVVRLMKFSLALHDIGKPIAIREKSKRDQHEFTVPILYGQLEKSGFRSEEAQFLEALMGHDELGRFIKGRAVLDETVEFFKNRSRESGLALQDFFLAQVFYYTVDAASYRFLRHRVFEARQGRLWPRAPHFKDLWQSLGMG